MCSQHPWPVAPAPGAARAHILMQHPFTQTHTSTEIEIKIFIIKVDRGLGTSSVAECLLGRYKIIHRKFEPKHSSLDTVETGQKMG